MTTSGDAGGVAAPPASITMRAPCPRCGEDLGIVTRKSMQDVVRCANCDRHCYNAPRTELGLERVSLSSRPDITPSRRYRILDAHGHACVSCHRSDVDLQIDHLISREDAQRFNFLDDIIDSDLNMAPMCAECTSGKRVTGSASIRLMYRCLVVASNRHA